MLLAIFADTWAWVEVKADSNYARLIGIYTITGEGDLQVTIRYRSTP